METDAVNARLEALPHMDLSVLRGEWRKLYGSESPRYISRDLIRLALAYRIQELAFGGLGKNLERRIHALSNSGISDAPTSTASSLSAGSRLVREWQGQTHTVLVLASGFEYQSKRFGSLSEIAGVITGAHCSGPRFFGIKPRSTSKLQPETSDG